MSMRLGVLPSGGADVQANARGIALVLVLVVLAAMSLAAAALTRAVDTTMAVAGNLGFREASVPPADSAIEDAIAVLSDTEPALDREHDRLARNYYASRQPGEDTRGVPWVLQQPGRYPAEARVLEAGDGNAVRYVIERMCLAPGAAVAANCALVWPYAPAGAPPTAPPAPYFRISVRVDGPQNAVSYVQAMVREATPPQRMAWRLITE